MGITARQRASVQLLGTTLLSPSDVIGLVKGGTLDVKGGGKSLLTTGVWNIGAHVNVVRSSETSAVLALTSGKKLVELCTFTASAKSVEGAATEVRVGGLETYKTSQQKLWFLIPVGPKMIHGMDPYKKYLNAVADRIRAADPAAVLTIAQPASLQPSLP